MPQCAVCKAWVQSIRFWLLLWWCFFLVLDRYNTNTTTLRSLIVQSKRFSCTHGHEPQRTIETNTSASFRYAHDLCCLAARRFWIHIVSLVAWCYSIPMCTEVACVCVSVFSLFLRRIVIPSSWLLLLSLILNWYCALVCVRVLCWSTLVASSTSSSICFLFPNSYPAYAHRRYAHLSFSAISTERSSSLCVCVERSQLLTVYKTMVPNERQSEQESKETARGMTSEKKTTTDNCLPASRYLRVSPVTLNVCFFRCVLVSQVQTNTDREIIAANWPPK